RRLGLRAEPVELSSGLLQTLLPLPRGRLGLPACGRDLCAQSRNQLIALGTGDFALGAKPIELRARACAVLRALLPGRLERVACGPGLLLRRLDVGLECGAAPLVLDARGLGFRTEPVEFRLRGGEALRVLLRRLLGLLARGRGGLPRLLEFDMQGG